MSQHAAVSMQARMCEQAVSDTCCSPEQAAARLRRFERQVLMEHNLLLLFLDRLNNGNVLLKANRNNMSTLSYHLTSSKRQ